MHCDVGAAMRGVTSGVPAWCKGWKRSWASTGRGAKRYIQVSRRRSALQKCFQAIHTFINIRHAGGKAQTDMIGKAKVSTGHQGDVGFF